MARKKSAPETLSLKPSEVAQALTHATKQKRAVFLWGPPGIGKSQIIAQIAKNLGYNFVDIRLSQMDPTDLRGIPYPTKDLEFAAAEKQLVDAILKTEAQLQQIERDAGDGTLEVNVDEALRKSVTEAVTKAVLDASSQSAMAWSPPTFYERDAGKKTLYFFDEMNAAAQSIQAAAYQIVLDRKIGEYKLGPDDVVFAAGNRETDKGATFKMPTPLMNRFVHLEMVHDFDDWQDWAIEAGIHKTVVGYLTWQKHELFDFDPTSASRGFPTPRSWEFVSELVKDDPNLPEMVTMGLISGSVGEAVAMKFIEYRKLNEKLPNPSDILKGTIKKLKDDQKETSIMYALTIGLCYELRDAHNEAQRVRKETAEEKLFDEWIEMADNFFQFMMDNFQPEMTILGARTILSNFKLKVVPKKMKSWKAFAQRHNSLILDN